MFQPHRPSSAAYKTEKYSVRPVYIAEGGNVWLIKFYNYVFVCVGQSDFRYFALIPGVPYAVFL